MKYKEHCAECEEKMGKQWNVVHRWLDEYAGQYWPSMAHRAHHHHKEGIEEVRKMWGDEAAKAAELHILSDMNQAPVLSEDDIPTREEIERYFSME